MRLSSIGLKSTIIGLVFTIGLIVGTILFGPAVASTLPEPTSDSTIYSKNQNGETYGSAADAKSIDAVPDLIRAYGVDGKVGYIRSSDFYQEMPKTPEEALAKQRQMQPFSVKKIPLYDVNGVNIIGEFEVKQGTETK